MCLTVYVCIVFTYVLPLVLNAPLRAGTRHRERRRARSKENLLLALRSRIIIVVGVLTILSGSLLSVQIGDY